MAFLLPLVLSPFILGRFIPLTVSARTVIKVGFLMVVVGDAIWMTPHGFVPTGANWWPSLELPSDWNFLALMPAKNSAAFTLVFVTVVNYVLYNRAIRQGTIVWGKIDFASQFVLVFLAFSSIWTMGLMGAVRSLLRKYFHTYNFVARLHRGIVYADAVLFRLVDYWHYCGLLSGRQFCHYRDAYDHPMQGARSRREAGPAGAK